MKIKNRSRKRSHKRDRIGVRRIRTFPFLPSALTTSSLTFKPDCRSRKQKWKDARSHALCDLFGFLLLFPTPTIRFSLDHKRNVSDGIVSGIETLFSLDHKLYASDYNSDYDFVASEKPPLEPVELVVN